MKVIFEFSGQNLPHQRPAIEKIRTSILEYPATLAYDLIDEIDSKAEFVPTEIFDKISRSIQLSSCGIIEGTHVSISLGYILTEMIRAGKPVLFLCTKGSLNYKNRFLKSIKSKLLVTEMYSGLDEIPTIVANFLKQSPDIKTRFNLVLNNELNTYLSYQSKRTNISKTEYLIKLLEKDMQKTKQF